MGLTRSEQMSRIRGKNTRPEVRLAAALMSARLRVTSHRRVEGVRVDLVLARPRVAVFIDGCFFHGCPRHYVRPRSNAEFWADKLLKNVERDRRQTLALEAAGWTVVRTWEHDVFERVGAVIARVVDAARRGRRRCDGRRVVRVEPINGDGGTERRVVATLRNPDRIVAVREGRRVTAKWRRSTNNRTPTSPRRSASTRGERMSG